MSLYVDPPFSLGQTLGVTSATDGENWVGVVKVFPDVNPRTGKVRSNRVKKCIAVRNVATVPLAGKKLVAYKTGKITEVDGYTTDVTVTAAGVVDEYLPAGGVAVNDVFWLTVDGPTEVTLGPAQTCALGTTLVAYTAAASTESVANQAVTSGASGGRAHTSASTLLLPGHVGTALSAGGAGTNVLANVKILRS